jgi:hypothetical protein
VINFRFHLVSITAVFLALAVGIAIGATVVDRATVATLESQLSRVDRRADTTNTENDHLKGQLGQWQAFADEGKDALVQGRLSGMRVLVVAARGTDPDPVDRLRVSLVSAGASLEGTVWFTSKLKLEVGSPDDVRKLATDVGEIALDRPDAARRAAMSRLAAAWAGPDPTGPANPLQAMVSDRFLDYEPSSTGALPLASLPQPKTVFVVVSSATAEVPNEEVALPFATELARSAPNHVLAAEPGREAQGKGQPAVRATFVGPLRQAQAGGAPPPLSTVDNLEDARGRIASVLALYDLARGKLGHYGFSPGVRQLPEPSS